MHSDDSNVDNLSMISEQAQTPSTPTSENGRIRPSRPAPSIPTGLSRSATRRSAPPPPMRSQASSESTNSLPQVTPRRSAPPLHRQSSVEDNAAYTVRTKDFLNICGRCDFTNNRRHAMWLFPLVMDMFRKDLLLDLLT